MKTRKKSQKPNLQGEQELKKARRNKTGKSLKRKISIYDDFEDLESGSNFDPDEYSK